MATKKTEEQAAAVYTKAQLMRAKRFCACRDILAVVLADGDMYTTEQAAAMVEKFKKGKVM